MSRTRLTPFLLLARALLQILPGFPELAATLALLLSKSLVIYGVFCPLYFFCLSPSSGEALE